MMSFVSCRPASFFHAGALVLRADLSAGRVVCAQVMSGAANSTATKAVSNLLVN
jgi:hypothetical protein